MIHQRVLISGSNCDALTRRCSPTAMLGFFTVASGQTAGYPFGLVSAALSVTYLALKFELIGSHSCARNRILSFRASAHRILFFFFREMELN